MKIYIIIASISLLLFNNCNSDSNNDGDSLLNLLLIQSFLNQQTTQGIAEVTTIAGSLVETGFVDATGSAARFTELNNLVIDSNGNIFGSDSNRIRKITPTGDVTTIAGSGTAGGNDGTGIAATFDSIQALAIDSLNNIYVRDGQTNNNNRIRKVTPDGVVTTIITPVIPFAFADGPAGTFRFDNINHMTIDLQDRLLLSDRNRAIRRTPLDTINVVTILGSPPPTPIQAIVDGTGTSSRFNSPGALAFDSSGNLYIGDNSGSMIRKASNDLNLTTFAGSTSPSYREGFGIEARFSNISSMVGDKSGNIYIMDSGRLRVMNASSAAVSFVAGRGPVAVNSLSDGIGSQAVFGSTISTKIAIDSSGNIYVADRRALRKVVPNP